jgi:hypothetical protein
MRGEELEQTGGFEWTWRRIFNNTLLKELGVWFSPRLIASNITQYIVSIYLLLYGVQMTKLAKDNYDVDDARDAVTRGVTKYLFDSTVDEQLLEYVLSNWTGLMSGFISKHSDETGFGCADRNAGFDPGFLETACNFTSGEAFTCDKEAGIDYVCAFADLANTTVDEEGPSIQQAMGVLGASGFDVDTMEVTIRSALEQAASNTVGNLYPHSQYM